MSIKENEERVHIYLNSDGKVESPVLKGASAHERYIILMNETLQHRVEKNLKKISSLENKVSILEEEVDRGDTRRNYIKGLLKNFHEMHKMNEKLTMVQTNMKITIQDSIKAYKIKLSWHLNILHTIFIVVIGISFELSDFWSIIILVSLFLTLLAFHYSMLKNLIIPTCTVQEATVKNITDEKKMILEAQDYIHEFIDAQ